MDLSSVNRGSLTARPAKTTYTVALGGEDGARLALPFFAPGAGEAMWAAAPSD